MSQDPCSQHCVFCGTFPAPGVTKFSRKASCPAPSYRVFLQWLCQQHFSKNASAVLGHLRLLLGPTRDQAAVKRKGNAQIQSLASTTTSISMSSTQKTISAMKMLRTPMFIPCKPKVKGCTTVITPLCRLRLVFSAPVASEASINASLQLSTRLKPSSPCLYIFCSGHSRQFSQSWNTHESTWFSKDRITGYGDVLKALSAMASMAS